MKKARSRENESALPGLVPYSHTQRSAVSVSNDPLVARCAESMLQHVSEHNMGTLVGIIDGLQRKPRPHALQGRVMLTPTAWEVLEAARGAARPALANIDAQRLQQRQHDEGVCCQRAEYEARTVAMHARAAQAARDPATMGLVRGGCRVVPTAGPQGPAYAQRAAAPYSQQHSYAQASNQSNGHHQNRQSHSYGQGAPEAQAADHSAARRAFAQQYAQNASARHAEAAARDAERRQQCAETQREEQAAFVHFEGSQRELLAVAEEGDWHELERDGLAAASHVRRMLGQRRQMAAAVEEDEDHARNALADEQDCALADLLHRNSNSAYDAHAVSEHRLRFERLDTAAREAVFVEFLHRTDAIQHEHDLGLERIVRFMRRERAALTAEGVDDEVPDVHATAELARRRRLEEEEDEVQLASTSGRYYLEF